MPHLLLLLLLIPLAVQANPLASPVPSASPDATPSPSSSPSPSISPSPSPVPTVSSTEARLMAREFDKAQGTEMQAMRHRRSFELNDLKAAHRSRRREWESKEQEARRKFFAENTKGPDRRKWVQEFLERRKAMVRFLDDEWKQRNQEWDVRLKALKESHLEKKKLFREELKKNQRPSMTLWPTENH